MAHASLALGITLAEIPFARRVPEMPLRFQNTIARSGLPAWQIRYHTSRFDEIRLPITCMTHGKPAPIRSIRGL